MTNVKWRIQSTSIIDPLVIEVYYNKVKEVEGETYITPVSTPLEVSSYSAGRLGEVIRDLSDLLDIELETLTPTPTILKSDWGNFNRLMFNNSAYSRVRLTTSNQDTRVTLESLLLALGVAKQDLTPVDYLFFQYQWGQIISGLTEENKPTEIEIENWNQFATESHIPIHFSIAGLIELT
jgi:hypothetical protein